MNQKYKSQGIIRNKFQDLLKAKGKKKVPKKRFSKAALRKDIQDDQVIKGQLLSSISKQDIQMKQFQPTWVPLYKQFCFLMKDVKALRKNSINQSNKQFCKKRKKWLQQMKRNTIKQRNWENVKKYLNNLNKSLNLVNINQKVAEKIRAQTKMLKNQQQSQLQRQQQMKNYHRKSIQEKTNSSEGWIEDDNKWLQQQEEVEIQSQKQQNQQVTKILKSIYSLNQIFKQLQGLVIQQGSLLDRIDNNIDATVENVQKANQNLQQAKKNQDSSCIRKVRRFLICAIVLLLIVFLFKHI